MRAITSVNNQILQRVKELNWDELFYTLGLPSYVPNFSNTLSTAAEKLAEKWITHATNPASNSAAIFSKDDTKGWSSQQICIFIESLLNYTKDTSIPFEINVLEEMDETYSFTASKNSEIRFRWQTLCLKSEAEWIVPQVVEFITTQGRMKFVRPLYRALRASRVGGDIAKTTFAKFKDMYVMIY